MAAFGVFGAGCFWGVEVAFRNVDGVTDVAVGYAGGHVASPSYEQVCGGDTGHAEVVRVEFDPERTSFDRLIDAFFECHDPTQLNRQGPDVGRQYRSVVLTVDEAQEERVRERIAQAEAEGRFGGRKIVTEVTRYEPETDGRFWRAEEYHQRYLEKKGVVSCRI